MSLTGDAFTDRLVPIASRLVGAVRLDDEDEVLATLGEARRVAVALDAGVEGAEALCVVLAAMVPWNVSPSDLLAWFQHQSEFHLMLEAGVPRPVAAELISQRWDAR